MQFLGPPKGKEKGKEARAQAQATVMGLIHSVQSKDAAAAQQNAEKLVQAGYATFLGGKLLPTLAVVEAGHKWPEGPIVMQDAFTKFCEQHDYKILYEATGQLARAEKSDQFKSLAGLASMVPYLDDSHEEQQMFSCSIGQRLDYFMTAAKGKGDKIREALLLAHAAFALAAELGHPADLWTGELWHWLLKFYQDKITAQRPLAARLYATFATSMSNLKHSSDVARLIWLHAVLLVLVPNDHEAGQQAVESMIKEYKTGIEDAKNPKVAKHLVPFSGQCVRMAFPIDAFARQWNMKTELRRFRAETDEIDQHAKRVKKRKLSVEDDAAVKKTSKRHKHKHKREDATAASK